MRGPDAKMPSKVYAKAQAVRKPVLAAVVTACLARNIGSVDQAGR